MKYISPLLKKFISINDTPENIAKNLILKTCEIEEIHTRILPDDVVIGKVLSFSKHPEADKLNVCQVDCGKRWTYEIVCGGENIAQNIYIPVALPHCFLPAINITIEPRKLRGIDSNGMICSKEELGINEDQDTHNIWNLTEDLEDISDQDLWISLKEKFPRLESRVMEVDNKSLTNRPDLTWHFGVATELNAIYSLNEDQKSKGESPSISFNKVKEYYAQCTPEHIMQILENSTKPERKVIGETNNLNAYLLLQLKNVHIKQSSFFSRLQMIDLWSNPINNRVDFSNLFMIISGQPIHFFDADKVDGDIIVRNAKDGEKFTDLFETEHILKASDVVIADKKKILALAGVVGGLESWITESTKNILVEIANFDPVAVRKTWTRLGLRTDAELRFEKYINPRFTLFCLILFLDELHYYQKDLGDFDIGWLSYYINEKIYAEKEKQIEIDPKAIEQFIFGKKIKWFDKQIEEILHGLWFSGANCSQFSIHQPPFIITSPLRRSPDDLNIKEDIYEEVARIYGYDQIENLPLMSTTAYVPYTDYIAIQRKLEDILVRTIGCNQTETYPRISEKTLQDFDRNKEHMYALQNPVNPEAPYMRDDMIYGLLAHTAKNSKFFDTFKIFDIGKIWKKENPGMKENNDLTNLSESSSYASSFVKEETQLGAMLYQKNIDQWDKDPILAAKEMVKIIAKELELGEITFEKPSVSRFRLHPKKQALIKSGDLVIGFLWSLHPLILQSNKIGETSGVVYLSLNITTIVEKLEHINHIYTYESLQDQIIRRDLCFVVDTKKDFDEVIAAVKKVAEVKDIEVFDVYAGKNLGEDKKSVSIKIKIIGDWSMTTEQINEVMNKAIKAAESAGGTLRA